MSRSTEYYKKHPKKKKEHNRLYRERHRYEIKEKREANKEILNEMKREWYQANKERARLYGIEWRKKHPNHSRDNYRKNKVKILERLAILRKKESYKKWKRDYVRNRVQTIPRVKLDYRMRANIWDALKGKKAGRSWEKLVGYTLQDLMKRLESLFDENMNWENQGFYWHIDHIKPKSLFNYETAEDKEFKECWSLSNLQPLEAKENLIKHNKYEERLQFTSNGLEK